MNRLNEKIAEILRQHPEGEPFFDALDAMVRGDMDILHTFLNFVYSELEYTKEYSIILSGQFGNAIMSIYGVKLFDDFSDVILVEGGLRSLKMVDSQARIVKTFVIYDGSKIKKNNLYSMFRYYDHYK